MDSKFLQCHVFTNPPQMSGYINNNEKFQILFFAHQTYSGDSDSNAMGRDKQNSLKYNTITPHTYYKRCATYGVWPDC